MYGLDLVIFVLGLLSQLVAPIPHNEDDDADEDGWKKFVVTDRAGSKPLGHSVLSRRRIYWSRISGDNRNARSVELETLVKSDDFH